VLGERAAPIHLAGLLEARAEAGVGGQLNGRGEAADVADPQATVNEVIHPNPGAVKSNGT
jgi:hypothetical protein